MRKPVKVVTIVFAVTIFLAACLNVVTSIRFFDLRDGVLGYTYAGLAAISFAASIGLALGIRDTWSEIPSTEYPTTEEVDVDARTIDEYPADLRAFIDAKKAGEI